MANFRNSAGWLIVSIIILAAATILSTRWDKEETLNTAQRASPESTSIGAAAGPDNAQPGGGPQARTSATEQETTIEDPARDSGKRGLPSRTAPVGDDGPVASERWQGDFPPYLSVAAQGRKTTGRGCRTYAALLAEMAEEARDPLWAKRVEVELQDMLGTPPNDFAVSVGCRATICQVTSTGDHAALLADNGRRLDSYLGEFADKFRQSTTATEFKGIRYFGGLFPTVPPRHIAGFILTSAGRGVPDESPECGAFDVPDYSIAK